jgi:hypothetical protein
MPLSDFYPEMKGWTPVESNLTESLPQIPTAEVQVSPYLRAPLPLPLQYAPDTLKQSNRPGLSGFRVAPLPPGGVPAINSAAATVTRTIVQNSGGGILLETGNIPNANQGVLNLLPGTNIQLASDINGGVTITGSGGDGLVHGDKIWAIDPAYVILRDEFISNSTGGIGQLEWQTFGTLNTSGYTGGLSAMNIGEFGWANSGIASQTGGLIFSPTPSTGAFQFGFPLLDFPGWKAIFIWRFHPSNDSSGAAANFLQKSMYIGFAFGVPNIDGAITRPNIFIGARYDTDTTAPAISDTTIKLEAVENALGPNTRNNTQGTVVNTGVTPAIDTYYRLEISCIASGVVTMSLNGSAPLTFNISTMVATAIVGSTYQASAGLGRITFANTTGKPPWFAGSQVTIAGLTGTGIPLNGLHTTVPQEGTNNTIVIFDSNLSIGSTAASGFTATGFPALFPIFNWGNDTVAAPTTDTRIMVDYFGFVWNKGLAGATNPNATLPRYW